LFSKKEGSKNGTKANGEGGGWFSKKDATDPPVHPVPACFKKHELSALNILSFKTKRGNESPQVCADLCTKIHDDEHELHTCHTFDYNPRSGTCHFFEKSSQDENVKLLDSTKADVYELDESCWRVRNGPPTLPPHVDACPSGSKPLMEKVTGWFLQSSGLAFKGVEEHKCYDRCLQDKLPSRDENYKCLSVSYNNDSKACVYLNTIASPLNRKGPSLKQDTRYNYYAKMCVSADTISKCKGYVTRFTGRELVGMNDAKLSTTTYPDCVKACLKAEQKLGFTCLSGMFYNNATTDNCILNYADHYGEPTLFVNDPNLVVDYFSVKSCRW